MVMARRASATPCSTIAESEPISWTVTVDGNPFKHGRYMPGMHIPIKPVEAIDAARPGYILILPWNLKQEIVEQMRHIGTWQGKFIALSPSLRSAVPYCGVRNGLQTQVAQRIRSCSSLLAGARATSSMR